MIVYDLKFSSEFLTCPDNPAEETKYLQKKKKIPSSPSLWISKKLKPAAVREPKIKPVAGGTLDVCLIAV